MTLQIILFHQREFNDPIDIEINNECTVSSLKDICLTKQDKISKRYDIGLVYVDDSNIVCFLNNESDKIQNNITTIYIFRVNDILIISAYLYDQIEPKLYDPITYNTKSTKGILSSNYTKIHFNKLLTTKQDKLAYDQMIIVPNSISIGNLRKILAAKVNIACNECVLRKKWNDSEYKNNKKLLKFAGIHSETIYVEKGRPLNENEFLFQLFENGYNQKHCFVLGYLHRIKEFVPESIANLCFAYFYEKEFDESLMTFIGDIIVNKDWFVHDLKFRIWEKYKSKVPHPNFMRLRDFAKEWNKFKMCHQFSLKDVYYDNLTVAQVLKSRIKDFSQIVVQRIEFVEKDKLNKEKHLLLNVCRYFPKQRQLSNVFEIQFEKDAKINSDVRMKLAQIVGCLPNEILLKCFMKQKRLNDVDSLHKLFEHYSLFYDDESTLADEPWKCKNGYFIVFIAKMKQQKQTKQKKRQQKDIKRQGKDKKDCIVM